MLASVTLYAPPVANQGPLWGVEPELRRPGEAGGAYKPVPIIAEEEVAAGRIPKIGHRFFLVDPLDGTKEFISRNGEFTINIAEINDGKPVRGVVYAPAKDRMFFGEAVRITTRRPRSISPLTIYRASWWRDRR